MKKILLLSIILLSSCDDSNYNNTNQTYQPEPKIEYIEKYCPNCNGIGEVKLSTGDKVLWGIATFGGGFMFETMECSMCDGTGIVKVRKLNQ